MELLKTIRLAKHYRKATFTKESWSKCGRGRGSKAYSRESIQCRSALTTHERYVVAVNLGLRLGSSVTGVQGRGEAVVVAEVSLGVAGKDCVGTIVGRGCDQSGRAGEEEEGFEELHGGRSNAAVNREEDVNTSLGSFDSERRSRLWFLGFVVVGVDDTDCSEEYRADAPGLYRS